MWYRTKIAQFGGGAIKQENGDSTMVSSPDVAVFKPEKLNVYKPTELNIQGENQSLLQKSLQTLGADVNYMYPEMLELIENMNLNADEVAGDANKLKALFDILVYRAHSNIPKDDDHSSGFEAMEARRHSPFHPNPDEENIENLLEQTRHNTTNTPSINDVQKTQGFMSIHGMPQYAKGKQSPLMMNTEIPSNRTYY
jgi:hypothetical protein